MANEEIVAKIKKLLALTRSSEPNEAAVAAARAQELMVKYAVEEHELAGSTVSHKEPIEVEALGSDTKKIPTWEKRLAHTVAKNFFCKTYSTPGVDIFVVGRRTDRDVMRATYYYLRGEVRRLCDEGWNRVGAYSGQHGKTWKSSFCLGAVTTIYNRLTENMKRLSGTVAANMQGDVALTVPQTTSTAIVLAEKLKEVEVWVEQNVGGLTKSQGPRKVTHDAFNLGKKAGETINLSPRNTKTLKGK